MFTPRQYLFEHLDDGSTDNMNVNGASTAVNYDYTVPTDKVVGLSRINWHVLDNAKQDLSGFFSLPALTKGLLFQILDDDGSTVLQDFDTTDHPITKTADVYNLAGIDLEDDVSGNESRFGIRWSIYKAAGGDSAGVMKLTAGQVVRCKVQDDLSGLTEFHMMVQGTILDA